MKRRLIALLLVLLLTISGTAGLADSSGITWTEEERARLQVGNPTAMQGRFFTSMWGGTTSDMDVQDLLHAYAPVRYDIDRTLYRFDHSVVQDAAAIDDEQGNRTYLIVFYDDLYWSDGTRITAADYAFSMLFMMDPVIAETGGKPEDHSWIMGADEYLDGSRKELSGLRILDDQILQIRVKAEALPYFYELSRFAIHPYPISEIAPGITVADDGEGAYLSAPLTKEMIQKTVLDPENGYLSHPKTVSGAYTLRSFDGKTASFTINPYFKGTEDGFLPRIGEIEYTAADNGTMIDQLASGEFDLLNKVTLAESISKGVQYRENQQHNYSAEGYARTGLTLLWFMESSEILQEPKVRKAIAYCFDREGFVQEYNDIYGIKMDAFCGIGQWMYRLASGQMPAPVNEELPEEEQKKAAEPFETLSLDGLTKYSRDAEKARELLETAGWRAEEAGVRKKTENGETEELHLVLGFPGASDSMRALEKHFVPYLEEAGIQITMRPLTMEEVVRNYRGEEATVDLLYLGEDFPIRYDPEILAPQGPADNSEEGSIPAVKAELYDMAKDMVRTEPSDLAGFMQKWIRLQERITETLPLLPVYSNVYFDFFTRELHNYRITRAVTWGEAIIKSFMSDKEEETEEERQRRMENEEAGQEMIPSPAPGNY